MAKKQVLCVDDNAFMLATLRHLLETNGYSVVSAPNGRMALASGNKVFDLIVVDYDLPDFNGLQVARELRKRHHSVPILMYSGCDEIPQDGMQHISAFVAKCDSVQRLLDTIGGLIAA
jgi:two-component system alkaline phosphatase synthesis response regulator PhoP